MPIPRDISDTLSANNSLICQVSFRLANQRGILGPLNSLVTREALRWAKIANRQSLVLSERGQLSQANPQIHVEQMLHE